MHRPELYLRTPILAALAIAGVLALLLVSGVPSDSPRAGVSTLPAKALTPTGASVGLPTVTLSDGASVVWNDTLGHLTAITDQVRSATESSGNRSYFIDVSASERLSTVQVRLVTSPLAYWGLPAQMPGGLENLPSIGYWSWSVYVDGFNATAFWTANSASNNLMGVIPWGTTAIQVVGTTHPFVQLTVQPNVGVPQAATRLGLILNDPNNAGPFPTNDSDYSTLLDPLAPSLIRIGMSNAGTQGSWNATLNTGHFNWTGFDATLQLAATAHAAFLLSLPVGTWGDGNLLPYGMPVNTSVPVTMLGAPGYFPTEAAYASYVGQVAAHVASSGAMVRYWNIGNEMPLVNATVVGGYITLFNLAARTIHATMPDALVGSDVMMDKMYLPQFAAGARQVGYLSFHYYPSLGLNVTNGTYGPPGGSQNATQDPRLLRAGLGTTSLTPFYPPHLAQILWRNLTGASVPVLVTETNLNAAGGTASTFAGGTDPRIQTLMGAAWVVTSLLGATSENVSSMAYFTLTAPSVPLTTASSRFGGWGFGLSRESTSDNDTRFAPYWALQLWASVSGPGNHRSAVTSSDPSVVDAIASRNGTNVSLLFVNKVNVEVSVNVSSTMAGLLRTNASVLDRSSYRQTYNASTGQEVLSQSAVSVDTRSVALSTAVPIEGYGVALLRLTLPAAANNSTHNSTSGNGSGGNGTNGHGTGGGGTGTGGGSGSGTHHAPGASYASPVHAARPPGTSSLLTPTTSTSPPANLLYPRVWAALFALSAVVVGFAAVRAGAREPGPIGRPTRAAPARPTRRPAARSAPRRARAGRPSSVR